MMGLQVYCLSDMWLVPVIEPRDPVGERWSQAINAAHDAMSANGPEAEACGWVYGRAGDTVTVVQCPNVSEEPGRFLFSDDDARLIYEFMDRNLVLGIWHSHPLGHRAPSDEDWAGHPRGVPLYIVAIHSDTEAEVYRYDESDRPSHP